MRHLTLVPHALLSLVLVTSVGASAQVPSDVRVEFLGDTLTWRDSHSVYETTEDAKFQTERYGTDFHVRVHGLPPDDYSIRIGFAEMKFVDRGTRRFSVKANGKSLLRRFDILDEVANFEALVKVFRFTLDDPVLDLHFAAERDNAKYCFIRIYNSEFAAEIPPTIPVTQSQVGDQPDAPYMAGMYETSIGKFGSRVAFNPRPKSRSWWQGALGHADYSVAHFERDHQFWADYPYEMAIGTEHVPADGPSTSYALPFTDAVASFPIVTQSITPTSLTYTCRAPDLPYELTLRYAAPFYPEDLKLSTAPYIRLDASVRDTRGAGAKGRVFVAQGGHGDQKLTPLSADGYVGWTYEITQFGLPTEQIWAAEAGPDISVFDGEASIGQAAVPLEDDTRDRDTDGRVIVPVLLWQPLRGLTWDFELGPGESAEKSFAYVGWCESPVLYTYERNLYFKYLEYFDTPTDVVKYVYDERATADRRAKLFESTVLDMEGLPPEYADFFSFAFQSYAMNTWYMSDALGDWYSCWEGCCKFHSTVDVEYNQWPFYLHYWPELARLTLDAWADHELDGVMPHDMGMGLEIGDMVYPHHMEVEEGTNYVLLLFAYWRATGDSDTVRKHLALSERLMAFVAECDTDDDGFPEEGTSNTIDQGSRVIQHAPKQVYLAVKALAAWRALAAMAEATGEVKIAEENADRAALVASTLREKAWLDTHYAIALQPEPRRQPEPRYGDDNWYGDDGMGPGMGARGGQSSYAPQPVSGWDGHSIYAGNGLLFPFSYGLAVDMDVSRVRQDLLASTEATLKRYGSPHTDREGNTWISQNIWRDMVAAYVGLDLADNVSRYWEFEVDQNRRKRGCFTDVYNYGAGSTSLDYYPRGITVAGLAPALMGMALDR
ncbi:MAG TPA: malectin domain-containing carbohydrate-binding protein, partial [Armatimonadota bacterium]|nr:malectin domain-containing carbohydrate-binding protein [Armatimonadota bacterium]